MFRQDGTSADGPKKNLVTELPLGPFSSKDLALSCMNMDTPKIDLRGIWGRLVTAARHGRHGHSAPLLFKFGITESSI